MTMTAAALNKRIFERVAQFERNRLQRRGRITLGRTCAAREALLAATNKRLGAG
jgi:hypothetical protein